MSGYMAVTVGTEEAVKDMDTVEDEHSMIGKDAVVDEEIPASGSESIVVLEYPGAVVAKCLSELTEDLSEPELTVCLLEAAVCPLEAVVCSL